ncbi:hypothetical protein ONZ51_g10317 [Trametes cubensis]|uniref:Uncharacterized protein n=1 Tax=Trametes cubensis TaxID=1111947 RepID=A0AAD7X6U5_9APHY|nr:hypothetical protein ONZ51_g10317 [Trametes cubensis]
MAHSSKNGPACLDLTGPATVRLRACLPILAGSEATQGMIAGIRAEARLPEFIITRKTSRTHYGTRTDLSNPSCNPRPLRKPCSCVQGHPSALPGLAALRLRHVNSSMVLKA